jgi:uncharacterized membrane protein YhaH (DUF805 family)
MPLLRLCFGFSGRMNRSEYAIMFFGSILAIVTGCGLAVALYSKLGDSSAGTTVIFSTIAFVVACKWAALVALAKRFHDVGASGALCLLVFVPLLGTLAALVMLFIPGTANENHFGPPTYLFKPCINSDEVAPQYG